VIPRLDETIVDVVHDVVSLPETHHGVTVVDRVPDGPDWRYEPDWDGLRIVVRCETGIVSLSSERDRPLGRYFPEIVDAVAERPLAGVTMRGSLVVTRPEGYSFDLLKKRIHPASSRVAQVSAEWPATLVLTDVVREGAEDVGALVLERRRDRLMALAERAEVIAMPAHLGRVDRSARLGVTPQTFDLGVANRWWYDADGVGRDGLIARHADGRAEVRVRRLRTAACVVTAMRSSEEGLRSLRLGMFDRGGLVEVGHTRAFRGAPARREATAVLASVAPGARVAAADDEPGWVEVAPELVCEVEFERLRGDRFRSAARLVRWLPDRNPSVCTLDQFCRGA
jgi:ATP-dependent DNA ligase